MAAVEYMLLKETESSSVGRLIIGEVGLKCPDCKKEELRTERQGRVRQAAVPVQGAQVQVPKQPGLGYRHTPLLFITLALMLNGTGMSPFGIRIVLGHMGVNVHADTISRWLAHYVALAERYTGPVRPPNLGNKLGADEKRHDVRGGERCFVMAMDPAARPILTWETAADKMDYDAARLSEAANAGKPCPIPITDGLSGYHVAFKRVFGALKGLFIHLCDIHIWRGPGVRRHGLYQAAGPHSPVCQRLFSASVAMHAVSHAP